jgi:hypothetical protein
MDSEDSLLPSTPQLSLSVTVEFLLMAIASQPLYRGILRKVEEHCVLGRFHSGINERCLLGL